MLNVYHFQKDTGLDTFLLEAIVFYYLKYVVLKHSELLPQQVFFYT
jgi:hypothetical protein